MLLQPLLWAALTPVVPNLTHSPHAGINSIGDVVAPNAIAALRSIVREYFVPYTLDCMVSLHAKQPRLLRAMQDVLSLGLPRLGMIKVQIETVQGLRRATHTRKFNIILVDGVEALEELHPAALTLDYDISEYYLVYVVQPCPNATALEFVTAVLHYFWRAYIVNVSVLYQQPGGVTVDLYAYFPFLDADNCQQHNVRLINTFERGWQRSLQAHIFPAKMQNLQNCSLKVAVWDTPPYLSYDPHAHGLLRVADFEGELILELARKINFHPEFVEPPNNEQRGKVFENGSTTGAIKMLQEHTADLSLGCFRYTLNRSAVLTGALPYYQTWQSYGVLRMAQPLSPIEIMIYPFALNTWFGFCLSLLLTFTLVYTAYYWRSRSLLARIMIGLPQPMAPFISLLGILLGMGLPRLPRNNFTRFVITCWFIYGYLMRCIYQSLLFKLLQQDMYHTPPKSLDELITQGFVLFMTAATYDTVNSAPRIQNGQIKVLINDNYSETSTYAYIEQHMDQRLAGVSPQDYLTYYVMSGKKRGMFYALPEKIFPQHITMYFTKHSYLIERFNGLFMNLRSQGLIDYWAVKHLHMDNFDNTQESTYEPIPLEDVVGIFVIYNILMWMACLTFGCEIIWFRLKCKREENFVFIK